MLWIQHSYLKTCSHSASCGCVVGWESRRACYVRSTCYHEACTFPRKRGVGRVKGGERALDWVVSAPDRTDGNSGLTPGITVSPGGVGYRFHRLGSSCVDSLRLFAGEDTVHATAGVGSRLPLDRTVSDSEVGVKPDGGIPVNAVCPRGVHPVGASSERTVGIIDGIVGRPRRLYVTHPLLA